jgi:hypothetical protein
MRDSYANSAWTPADVLPIVKQKNLRTSRVKHEEVENNLPIRSYYYCYLLVPL